MDFSPDLPPIASITDLVEYFLSSDNDSSGCDYIRGWISLLDGTSIQPDQAAALLFFLRDDREVYDLFMQVAKAKGFLPTIVVMLTIDKLTAIYQEHNANGRDENNLS